jgi:hypothetical protein
MSIPTFRSMFGDLIRQRGAALAPNQCRSFQALTVQARPLASALLLTLASATGDAIAAKAASEAAAQIIS